MCVREGDEKLLEFMYVRKKASERAREKVRVRLKKERERERENVKE